MNEEKKLIEDALAQSIHYEPLQPDGVILVRAAELTPAPVVWLWQDWLPLGKLVLLAGAPGTGKTTLAIEMAAIVTRGGTWPDGTTCLPGDVLIWSGEDDAQDTLLPRLMAAGADLSRVHFISNVREQGHVRPFDPAADTPALLKAAMELPGLRFILVDPVVSAVAGDSHKNTEVRRALQPLVEFAAATSAVLLGITHFSKGGQGQDPTQRVTGSIAFAAVARVVLVAGKAQDEEGNDRRVLARSKSNLGSDEGGIEYALEQCEAAPGIQCNRVIWGSLLEGNARDLLIEQQAEVEPTGTGQRADQFLRERLALGSCPAETLYREAEKAGFSRKAIYRASKSLPVHKVKGGMKEGWYWTMRSTEGARGSDEEVEGTQAKLMGTFGTFEASSGIFQLEVEAYCEETPAATSD